MTPYYDDGDGHVIYHADCREVLPNLDVVDHVMTDPPYSEDTHAGARTFTETSNRGPKLLVNFMSINPSVINEILSQIKARRWGLLTVDWQHVLPLKQLPPKGWKFVRHGIWVKPNPMPQLTGDRPGSGWEAIAILHSDLSSHMQWNGGGIPAVWVHNKITAKFHPTGKPEPLLQEWVKKFTDPGETILDPFAGSCTTLVAAKQFGRRAIGIEIEEKYCEIGAKRLQQNYLFTGDQLKVKADKSSLFDENADHSK